MKEYKYESMILQAYAMGDLSDLIKMYESWKTVNEVSRAYGRPVLIPDVLNGGLLSLAYGLPRIARGARFQAYHIDDREGYIVRSCGIPYDLMPYHPDQSHLHVLFLDFYGEDGKFSGEFDVYQIRPEWLKEAARMAEERAAAANRHQHGNPRISIKRDIVVPMKKKLEEEATRNNNTVIEPFGDRYDIYNLEESIKRVEASRQGRSC